MKPSEKAKIYDKIRSHILSAEQELGNPPPMRIPYMPDVSDEGAVRSFYKHLKASAVEHAEWYSREKEISAVRRIFEIAGEDMRSVRV